MPLWPEVECHKGASLNAVSAFAQSGHEPAIAAAIFDAGLKQRLDSEQIEARAGAARPRRSRLAGNGFHVIHAARH